MSGTAQGYFAVGQGGALLRSVGTSVLSSTAQWRDKATIGKIAQLDATLDGEQACGAGAINGLLLAAQRHHLSPHLLDLRNSGDTAGDRDRVVGYAALAFSEEHNHAHH